MKILHEKRDPEEGWLDALVFEFKGKVFRCESKSIHVSASEPAIISNARWYYEVEGGEGGASRESGPDDRPEDVMRWVIEDWQARSGKVQSEQPRNR